jgi:hypothetical protein
MLFSPSTITFIATIVRNFLLSSVCRDAALLEIVLNAKDSNGFSRDSCSAETSDGR